MLRRVRNCRFIVIIIIIIIIKAIEWPVSVITLSSAQTLFNVGIHQLRNGDAYRPDP